MKMNNYLLTPVFILGLIYSLGTSGEENSIPPEIKSTLGSRNEVTEKTLIKVNDHLKNNVFVNAVWPELDDNIYKIKDLSGLKGEWSKGKDNNPDTVFYAPAIITNMNDYKKMENVLFHEDIHDLYESLEKSKKMEFTKEIFKWALKTTMEKLDIPDYSQIRYLSKKDTINFQKMFGEKMWDYLNRNLKSYVDETYPYLKECEGISENELVKNWFKIEAVPNLADILFYTKNLKTIQDDLGGVGEWFKSIIRESYFNE